MLRQSKVQESLTFWSFWQNSVLFIHFVASVLSSWAKCQQKSMLRRERWRETWRANQITHISFWQKFWQEIASDWLMSASVVLAWLSVCTRRPPAVSAQIFVDDSPNSTKWPSRIRNFEKKCENSRRFQVLVEVTESQKWILDVRQYQNYQEAAVN